MYVGPLLRHSSPADADAMMGMGPALGSVNSVLCGNSVPVLERPTAAVGSLLIRYEMVALAHSTTIATMAMSSRGLVGITAKDTSLTSDMRFPPLSIALPCAGVP